MSDSADPLDPSHPRAVGPRGDQSDPAAPPTPWERTVYEHLRRVAGAYLRRERADHTLQPTALVHEAYLKLAREDQQDWDEARFRAAAARTMRQVLVDHARRRGAIKRGGGRLKVTIDEIDLADAGRDLDLVALDEALEELANLDERKSRVVELRFFGGLTSADAAEALGIAPKTAEADWYMARAWLLEKLGEDR